MGDTIAAVNAILCEEEVKAAVQGEACTFKESSKGFGTCDKRDGGVGKGAPKVGGGNIAVPGDEYGGNGAVHD